MSKTTLQLEALQQALTNKGESSAQRGRHEQAVRYQERLRSLQGEIKELRKRGKEYSTLERLNRERCVPATLRNTHNKSYAPWLSTWRHFPHSLFHTLHPHLSPTDLAAMSLHARIFVRLI